MAAEDSAKFQFTAAAITGTAAAGLLLGPAATPLMAFAGGAALNMAAGFLNDFCNSAKDIYDQWSRPPDAPARNYDLAQLAGRAIAAIVAKAHGDYSGPGRNLLDSAARIKAAKFAEVLDTGRFREIGSERLTEFLGAPHGGISDRAARGAIWYELLVACLPADLINRAGLPGTAASPADELPPAAEGLVFAAKRLWERFPAQFNGELRDDPKHDGRAWIAFQSQMLRRQLELAQTHFRSHREFKAQFFDFARRTDAILASMAAKLEHADALRDEIRQTRNLATSIYCAVDEISRVTRDIREIVAGGPEIRPCNEALPADPGMLFAHQRIPFVLRDAELDELRAFLASPAKVAWWLWTGAAGMGKSRLAHELCREFDHNASNGAGGWTAGFLDIRGDNPATWKNWRPQRPTLIVVDYAWPKAQWLGPWIADLVRAAEKNAGEQNALGPLFPVRLLLLERYLDEGALRVLAPPDQRGDAVGRARFTIDGAPPAAQDANVAPPRALTPFRDEDLPTLAAAVYQSLDKAATPEIRARARPTAAEAAAAIRAGALEHRPLFVTVAAEAAYNGRDVTRLNVTELVDQWLDLEREQWARRAGLNVDNPDFHKLERLLALATICYGLPAPKGYTGLSSLLQKHDIHLLLPPAEQFAAGWSPLDSFLSLPREATAERLPPIQPDYFGERFALGVLRHRVDFPAQRSAFFDAALEVNSIGALQFLSLAAGDFPQDEIVHAGTRQALSFFEIPNPLSVPVHVLLFTIAERYRLGEAFAQAEQMYDWLIRQTGSSADPRHAASRSNLAVMLKSFADAGADRGGQNRTPAALYAEAETLYREAMAADPRDAASRYNLAVMLQSFADAGADRGGKSRTPAALYAEAETLYREAMAADPRHAASRYNLAVMLQSFADAGADRGGQNRTPAALYAEAETLYREAMAADPRDAASRSNLAVMLKSFADAGADRGGQNRTPAALYAEAETLYREAMAADPRQAASRSNLAVMLQSFADAGADRGGQSRTPAALYAEAETLYREAMAADPRHAASRYNLAVMLQSFADAGADRGGQNRTPAALYAEAETLYREAMAADPRHAASRYNLAVMLKSFADAGADRGGQNRTPAALYAEAETLYREAMAADPRDADSRSNLAVMLQSFADAGADRGGKSRTPAALYAEAERLYGEAMAADPRHAASRYNLAVMLQSFADAGADRGGQNRTPAALYAEAETLYREAMAADPRDAASRYNLAVMLKSFADAGADRGGKSRTPAALYAEAERLYGEAMAADPRDAASRYNLAVMLKSFADAEADRGGQSRTPAALYAEAETLYREAMAADPRDAASRYNLAVMLKSFADAEADRGGQSRTPAALYAEAETLYREAMAADPRHAASRSNLALMLQSFADAGADRGGQNRTPAALYAEAETLYREAMAADPRQAASRSNLAVMLIAMVSRGEREQAHLAEAEALVLEALKLEEPTIPGLLVAATLLLARGEREAGKERIAAALELAGGIQANLFGLLALTLLYFHRLLEDDMAVLGSIRRFVVEGGGRLPRLCLHRNAAQAAAEGHPEGAWLERLAALLEGRAAAETVDDWPRWRETP